MQEYTNSKYNYFLNERAKLKVQIAEELAKPGSSSNPEQIEKLRVLKSKLARVSNMVRKSYHEYQEDLALIQQFGPAPEVNWDGRVAVYCRKCRKRHLVKDMHKITTTGWKYSTICPECHLEAYLIKREADEEKVMTKMAAISVNNTKEKQCNFCGKVLPIEEFAIERPSKNTKLKFQYTPTCKSCTTIVKSCTDSRNKGTSKVVKYPFLFVPSDPSIKMYNSKFFMDKHDILTDLDKVTFIEDIVLDANILHMPPLELMAHVVEKYELPAYKVKLFQEALKIVGSENIGFKNQNK